MTLFSQDPGSPNQKQQRLQSLAAAKVPSRKPTLESVAPAKAREIVETYRHPLARSQPTTFWGRFADGPLSFIVPPGVREEDRFNKLTPRELEVQSTTRREILQNLSDSELRRRGGLWGDTAGKSIDDLIQDDRLFQPPRLFFTTREWSSDTTATRQERMRGVGPDDINKDMWSPWGSAYLGMDKDSDDYLALSAEDRFLLERRKQDYSFVVTAHEMLADYNDPNIEDPEFDWADNLELWKELKEQTSSVVWDDILDSRSEYEARLFVKRHREVSDAEEAWGMWYRREAQDTLPEQLMVWPQVSRMGRAILDPTLLFGVGASMKITSRMAKSISTMSKLSAKGVLAGVSRAEVAEMMLAMTYTHAHALHRGTTEQKDQYLMTLVMTGVLAGIPNTYLGVKTYKARVRRVQDYGAHQGARQSAVTQLESEFNTTHGAEVRHVFGSEIIGEGPLKGARITTLGGDGADQWYRQQLIIETEAVQKALAGRGQQIPVDSPQFRDIVMRRIQRKKELLDEISVRSAEIEVMEAQTRVVHDIDNMSLGNTIYKGILDDVFETVPTDAAAYRRATGREPFEIEPVTTIDPPTPGTLLDTDYLNTLGGAQRYLLQDEAFGAKFPRHRAILLGLTEGRPHFLDVSDIRMLSKESPELLANLDLDHVMKKVADNRASQRAMKEAERLKALGQDGAEYASVVRRAVPKSVGDLVYTPNGRIGQVISVSPSGQTITVDFGFVRERSLRLQGKIERPRIEQIEGEIVAAKEGVEPHTTATEGFPVTRPRVKKHTAVESARLRELSGELLGKIKKQNAKISKFKEGKLRRLESQITNAEAKLESATAGLTRLKSSERVQSRPKALAAAEERVSTTEATLKKKKAELVQARGILDDLAAESKVLDQELNKVFAGEEYKKLTAQIVEERKTSIIELEEALELERLKQPDDPKVADLETFANRGSVAVMRADQLATFILDSPMGQTLFPTMKKWETLSSVRTSTVKRKVKGRYAKQARTVTESSGMISGFRVDLKLFYHRVQNVAQGRSAKGTWLPKETTDAPIGTISPGSKRWRADLTDLDGRRYFILLDEPSLSKARVEIAERITQLRVDDATNPARLGELIGQSQAARNMNLFEHPSLIEQVAEGNIPKRFDPIAKRPSLSMKDWDILDMNVDSGRPLTNLENATFSSLTEAQLKAKNGSPVLEESAASISEQARATELQKGATVEGHWIWRFAGLFGFRGNLMSTTNNLLTTAGYKAFGGGGAALREIDGGGFVQSGTGMGTIGAGGIVPNRSLMVKEYIGPIARDHMENLAEYTQVVGKSMGEVIIQENYNTDIIKFRLYEGELPSNPKLHDIIKKGSEITTRGFDAQKMFNDPRIGPFAPELSGIKVTDNYVMRSRSLPKMKQYRSNVVEYFDPGTNKWVTVDDGIDFMYHHYKRMMLAGNPDYTPAVVELLSRRFVRMYLSESSKNLHALDMHMGTKFSNATEFVEELNEMFRRADELNIPKKGTTPDIEGGSLALSAEEQKLILKDLGAIEKKLAITMPRMNLADVQMKVKMLDGSGGTTEQIVRMHDYFDTDLVGLASQYHTQTIAHAGMQAFLREFWTDTWKPTRFREFKEAMMRAQIKHLKGKTSFFESKDVLGRQLDIMENALLARPQYNRLDSWAAILHTISNVSVLRALPGFTQAQYPEMHGAIFANGYGKVLRRIPVLGTIIEDAAMGRMNWKQASDYANLGLGMGMTDNVLPSMYSKIGHIEDGSPLVPGPGTDQTRGMRLVSQTNDLAMRGIPKVGRWGLFAHAQNVSDIGATIELHNALVQIARTTDPARKLKLMDRFAGRENVRLAQYGSTREAFNNVIEELSQDGAILTERVRGLEKTEYNFEQLTPQTKAVLDDLHRQWIKYYVQRSDDYAMPSPFITSQLGKLTQQFRQFTWGSNLNHMARSIQARDSRAMMSVMNMIIGGTLVHAAMGYLRYWNDPNRLKDYMSIGNIIKGIVMRSSFLGMAVDLTDTLYYIAKNDTIFSYSGKPMGMQLPALNTAKEITKGASAVWDSSFGGEGLNKGNYYHIKNLFEPVTNSLQFQWFFDSIGPELPN